MTTRTVVCPECAEPLPYGRLSCPACGALLASVAGVARRSEPLRHVAGVEVDEASLLVPDDEPLAAPDPLAAEGPGRPEELDPGTLPVALPDERGAGAAGVRAAESPPAPGGVQAAASPPAGAYPVTAPADGSAPDAMAAPPPVLQSYVPAGAYMPPSAVFAPPPAAAAPKVRPGDAPLLADLPFDAPDDLPGWLVASGAAIATIGFFVPWAHRLIAASGEGYLSAWGLGALMHLPVFAAVLVTLGLAVLPNRIPGWLRTGALPLVLGGLLLGLAWPYVFVGPLRGQLGSLLEAFAGLILVAGGILALRAGRHGGSPPAV